MLFVCVCVVLLWHLTLQLRLSICALYSFVASQFHSLSELLLMLCGFVIVPLKKIHSDNYSNLLMLHSWLFRCGNYFCFFFHTCFHVSASTGCIRAQNAVTAIMTIILGLYQKLMHTLPSTSLLHRLPSHIPHDVVVYTRIWYDNIFFVWLSLLAYSLLSSFLINSLNRTRNRK